MSAMNEMKAAMEALGSIKKYAKDMMGQRKKKSLLDKLDDEQKAKADEEMGEAEALQESEDIEGAVPGGSASKPDENPGIYGDSRLPENLDGEHEDDDDVTVVLMSGRKAVKNPKGPMRY